VFAQLQAGCAWLRQYGKTAGHEFNVILGETAISDLYANTKFLARQNLFNMKLDNILPPQKNAVGGVYHGTMTCGPYHVNVWSYPEYYNAASTGTFTPYINAKKGFLIPVKPKFKMAFGAVPQLLEPGKAPLIGQFVFSDYIDKKAKTHEYHVESAGVPVPTAIDQIYTFQAVA
jgi:hypothetical protein